MIDFTNKVIDRDVVYLNIFYRDILYRDGKCTPTPVRDVTSINKIFNPTYDVASHIIYGVYPAYYNLNNTFTKYYLLTSLFDMPNYGLILRDSGTLNLIELPLPVIKIASRDYHSIYLLLVDGSLYKINETAGIIEPQLQYQYQHIQDLSDDAILN